MITKAVFQSGMSWAAVESKWAGFEQAFSGFEPDRVAAFTPDDVDRLANDTRIIRNRRKIEATIHNAEAIAELDGEEGGFGAWLDSHGEFEPTLNALVAEFKYLGDFGAYYTLYVVGRPVPEYDEARALIDSRK